MFKYQYKLVLSFDYGRRVPGAYSDRERIKTEAWNAPKEWFLSKKRPKEGERVAGGHFQKKWVKALENTRILGPADLKNLFSFPRYSHFKIPEGPN